MAMQDINIRCLPFCLAQLFLCTAQPTEILSGTISPKQNLTFVLYLDRKTTGSYSTVTWQYSMTSRYYPKTIDRPVVYFRHVGQESGYGTEKHCFGRDFQLNYALDSRLVPMSGLSRRPGLDKECIVSGDNQTVTCTGSLKVAVGVKRQFYVSTGFLCGFEKPIDMHFNISVTGIPDGQLTCTNWADALDELDGPIFLGLKQWVKQCSQYYGHFSRWNILGLAQYDYLNIVMFEYDVISADCYKYLSETHCRFFAPECANATAFFPCLEQCMDFNRACVSTTGTKFYGKFNISCTSLASKNDLSKPKQCFYQQVYCDATPELPSHVTITSQNGSVASSIANVTCVNRFYKPSHSHAHATCQYNGAWQPPGIDCRLIYLYVGGVAFVGLVSAIIALGCVTYAFRFELKLLTYKYCSCLLCCFCRCRRTRDRVGGGRKKYHAFVAYEHDQQGYVRTRIHEPLKGLGYQICVDYEHFGFSDNLIRKIPESISQSSRVIIVLNQDFLNSTWCQYELDQAIMQSLQDASLKFLVILMQDKASLKKVPRWLRGYLRTHIYVEKNDPFFMSKLLNKLPGKTIAETAMIDSCEDHPLEGAEGNDSSSDVFDSGMSRTVPETEDGYSAPDDHMSLLTEA